MSDDPKKKGAQDRSRISTSEDYYEVYIGRRNLASRRMSWKRPSKKSATRLRPWRKSCAS